MAIRNFSSNAEWKSQTTIAERGYETCRKIERGEKALQRAGPRGESDKNLYRYIRLGRIVNSNGRVIGSIVKKEKEKEGRYRSAQKRDVTGGRNEKDKIGSKMKKGGRMGVGWLSP